MLRGLLSLSAVWFCVFVQGKFYLLIEELSQLFRALVPIQLWYKYIMGEDPSNSYFLGATLIIIYSLCKVIIVWLQNIVNYILVYIIAQPSYPDIL